MSITKEIVVPPDMKVTTHGGGRKGINIQDIVALAEKGLSHTQIGKILNCDHSNITRRLQAIGHAGRTLLDFKTARGDVLAGLQNRIVQHLTNAKLQKSSAYQLTGMLGILYDKERLERGESTSNISVFEHIVAKSHTKPPKYT